MKSSTIGVAGVGLLGRGIAACLLSHGYRVIAYDSSRDALAAARTHIGQAIEDLITRGGFPAALRDEWRARYTEATNLSEFSKCDFVIESVFESIDVKRAVFDEIEAAVGPSVPIGSNTSAISLSTLQIGRRHPGRFVGMHWCEPCHVLRFVEVIRGEQTDDATIDATLALARACGKDPCLVRKDIDGFIVNRIGYAMYREALYLLESGVADVETIDTAFRNVIGLWAAVAGPFRWMDLTGLPAYAAVMQRLFPQLSNAADVPQTMTNLIDSGAAGASNLRGFYRYTPAEAQRWQELLVEQAWSMLQKRTP